MLGPFVQLILIYGDNCSCPIQQKDLVGVKLQLVTNKNMSLWLKVSIAGNKLSCELTIKSHLLFFLYYSSISKAIYFIGRWYDLWVI